MIKNVKTCENNVLYHSKNFPMITLLLSALQFSLIYVKRLEIGTTRGKGGGS